MAINHFSGSVYSVVRLSAMSQKRLGRAMSVSRKAAAGLGTAPPSRSLPSALTQQAAGRVREATHGA